MHRQVFMLSVTPIAAVFVLFHFAQLRMNTSASLPVGLYIASSEGNYVEFCPDDHSLSSGRHYRAKGVCPDGAAPLLKPLVAKPGDQVVFNPAGLAVNGKLIPHTAPLSRDSEGRPLSHWSFGNYATAPRTLWVASSYNFRSYDSRYFGPIRESVVRARLRALIVW